MSLDWIVYQLPWSFYRIYLGIATGASVSTNIRARRHCLLPVQSCHAKLLQKDRAQALPVS